MLKRSSEEEWKMIADSIKREKKRNRNVTETCEELKWNVICRYPIDIMREIRGDLINLRVEGRWLNIDFFKFKFFWRHFYKIVEILKIIGIWTISFKKSLQTLQLKYFNIKTLQKDSKSLQISLLKDINSKLSHKIIFRFIKKRVKSS